MARELFVKPPAEFYSANKYQYFDDYPTYTYYNYLRPGVIQKIKRRRFEVALRLAEPWFYRSNAIDFGCSDGVFLPSLSRYFKSVVGFDVNPTRIGIAEDLCDQLDLRNVRVVCTESKPTDSFIPALQRERYTIAFVLETLEHIGQQPCVYESKIECIESLFNLLDDDAVIIISVPKMVGISFLAKYAVQTLLHMRRESYTLSQLLKSSLLQNTEELEQLWDGAAWDGGHKGFNHIKLEKYLEQKFTIRRKAGTVTTRFYVVTRGESASGS